MSLPRVLITASLGLLIAAACGGGETSVATSGAPTGSPLPTSSAAEVNPSSEASSSIEASDLPSLELTPLPSPTEPSAPESGADEGSPLGAIGSILLVVIGLAVVALTLVLVSLGLKNFTNFRATIEEKEWVIAPASHIDESTQAAILLQERVVKLTSEIMLLTEALTERHEHLQILTSSLAERDDQIKTASIGVEQHARIRSLRYVAQIAEILEIDRRAGIEPNKTLTGLKSEVEHILEEAGVVVYEPKVGEKLPQRGVSLKRVKTLPAPSPELAGTIRSIEAPAYLYVGPNEQEVVLQPMAITVYSSNQEAEEGK